MTIALAPSILTADFSRLGAVVAELAAADELHFDVMDGHFVPNLSFGTPVLRSLAKVTELPIDAHLMVAEPDRWAESFVEAGATTVTVHAEAVKAPVRLARRLRAAGARCGLAINPGTPVSQVADLIDEIDRLLVMTVEPGFGGQRLIEHCLTKLGQVRQLANQAGRPDLVIAVDGGVNRHNLPAVVAAGADISVIGQALIGASNPAAELQALRELTSQF